MGDQCSINILKPEFKTNKSKGLQFAPLIQWEGHHQQQGYSREAGQGEGD